MPGDPREAALYWSARRMLGFTTPGDEAAFRGWLASPDHAAAFAQVDSSVESAGDYASMSEIRTLREAALTMTPSRFGEKRAIGRYGLVAASVLGLMILVGLLANRPAPIQHVADGYRAAPMMHRYFTNVGERRTVALADGSTIELDTASLVQVSYSPNQRDITLLRGQALFKVAHNAARPFVVTAGDRQITATGTAFDVRVDRGKVQVVLVEGHVTIAPLEHTGLAVLLPALDQQKLSPGEVLVATAAQPVQISATDVDEVTSWRQGQIVFRDETLAAAAAELNRYSTRQLIVQDPRIANLKVSGVFGADHQDNFVAAVTDFYPIEARQDAAGATVLEWRSDPSKSGS